MIDIDRPSRLRTLRQVALAGGLTCAIALVANLCDMLWPADVTLAIGVIVFFVHALNYSAELHQSRIDVGDPHDN